MGIQRTALLVAVALGAHPSVACAQTARTAGTSAELFRSRCIGCHVPPDPRFAVERAWLEQVLDTA